jgi:nucleoside-diphosphate-sugar epimerase
VELTGRTLAITGIGGFIGMHAAERALARGMKVRGIDRDVDAVRRANGRFDVFTGDVTDPAATAHLCQGANVVLHTAARVEEDGDLRDFRHDNVEGTRVVARGARAAGVSAVVHLSSVMVYGFRFRRHVTEEGPLNGDGNPYNITKIESEAALEQELTGASTRYVVVRPGDVYGPGSVPWVLRPLRLMKQRVFVLPDGGHGIMNHVFVDNLMDAIFASIEKEVSARAFNVTDDFETTFASYFRHIAAMIGRGAVPTLPSTVLRRTFGALAWGAHLLGRKPLAHPSAVDFLTRPQPYSVERARRELGYVPRVDLDGGMRRVEAWLRETGEL